MNAAIQEGKSVEEIAKEVQKKDQEQPQEIPEVTAKTAEETTKSDQKQESKPKLKPKPKPAVNADGEVIHADSNWKSFLVKNGKTMKPPKIVKKTPAPKPEKTEAFFDFEKEKTTKKVPLVKRQKKWWFCLEHDLVFLFVQINILFSLQAHFLVYEILMRFSQLQKLF